MPARAGCEDEKHQDSVREQVKQTDLEVFILSTPIKERSCIENSERNNHSPPQDAFYVCHKSAPFLATPPACRETHIQRCSALHAPPPLATGDSIVVLALPHRSEVSHMGPGAVSARLASLNARPPSPNPVPAPASPTPAATRTTAPSPPAPGTAQGGGDLRADLCTVPRYHQHGVAEIQQEP